MEDLEKEKQAVQQRADGLQRDKLRLEGELEEAERQVKLAKARQAKQGAAREESKESKVSDEGKRCCLLVSWCLKNR